MSETHMTQIDAEGNAVMHGYCGWVPEALSSEDEELIGPCKAQLCLLADVTAGVEFPHSAVV